MDEGPERARPRWEDDPPDPGLSTFVAVATGLAPLSAPEDGDDGDGIEMPRGDRGRGERGRGALRWWHQLRLWEAVPRGVLLAAAAGAVVVALIAMGVVAGGGPVVDPALPVAGAGSPAGRGGTDDGAGNASPDEGAVSGAGGDPTGAGAAPKGGGVSAAGPGGGGLRGDEAVVVHVAGAVVNPGVHRLPAGSRVHEAIAAAGGALPEADLNRLNLAAPVSDGNQVHVATLGSPPGAAGGGGSGGSTAGAGGPVSLSTADVAALDALPGVGPSTAAAIIAYREAHGPFGSVEELLEVRGIGEAKLDGLRDLVVP